MKGIPIIIFIIFFVACNDRDKQITLAETNTSIIPDNTVAAPTQTANFPLMDKYDCKSCHKTDEKFQGPSYLEIRNKYIGQDTALKYLSLKIIEGGSGVWGTIPMAPHTNLPQAEAKEMAKYILSLK